MDCFSPLAAAAAAALVAAGAWLRARGRGGRRLRSDAAELQEQVSQLHRQLREGHAAWQRREQRLDAQLRERAGALRRTLLAVARREAGGDSSNVTSRLLPSVALGGIQGGGDAKDAFELKLSFVERDRLEEAVLGRAPALALLERDELLQRLAVYDASGSLLPPVRGALPACQELFPVRVRYAGPQVRTANPRLRGILLGDLLRYFENCCGDVAFEDGDLGMLPVCMPTKLARLCNRQNIRAAQRASLARPKELQPNMYAVESLLLRPLTEPERLSAAEVWCPGGATIEIFVSHFWGEDFGEFVQSTYRFVLRDFRTRFPKLGLETLSAQAMQVGLYVCAFSNNQWNLKCEMGSRVEDSPFYKVLKADTTTTVIMNLDQMANSLLRAWCSFEFYFSHVLRKNTALNCRFGPLRRLGSGGDSGKVAEIWMLHVFELLQDVDIRLATASKAEDLALIQAEIASFVGSGCADGLRGAEALNRLLKSMIASEVLPVLARLGNLAALDLALQNGADVEAADHRYIRPLTHAAAAHGPQSPVVQRLLAQGADPTALAHAEVVVQLFSEDSVVRQSALSRIKGLLSPRESHFHRATLRLARQQHLAHCATLLKALAQIDEKITTSLSCKKIGSGAHSPAMSSSSARTPEMMSTPSKASPDRTAELVSKACESLREERRSREPSPSPESPRSRGEARQVSGSSCRTSGLPPAASPPISRVGSKASEATVSSLSAKGRTRLAPPRIQRMGTRLASRRWRHRPLPRPIITVGLENDQSRSSSEPPGSPHSHRAPSACSGSALLNMPVIVEHLVHEDSSLRLAACEVLGDLGSEAVEHAPQLVERLGDEDESVRLVALSALARVGAEALEPEHVASVTELLEDESAEVREAACEALASLGEHPSVPEAVVASLATTLDDSNPDVRLAAVEALSSLGPAAFTPHTPAIAQLLQPKTFKRLDWVSEGAHEEGVEEEEAYEDSDDHEELRVAALSALAQVGEEAAEQLPAITQCLQNGNCRVREAACGALANMGESAAAHASELADCLGDSDGDVRSAACAALAQLGDAAAAHAPEIADCLGDSDGDVRSAACAALAQLGDAAAAHAPEIAVCLADGDAEVRSAAVGALAQLGEAAIPHAPLVVECLADQSNEVRRTACECLGQLGEASASDAVRSLLADRDSGVQEAAAEALAEMMSASAGEKPH